MTQGNGAVHDEGAPRGPATGVTPQATSEALPGAERIQDAERWLDPRPPGYVPLRPAELAHLVPLSDLRSGLAVLFDVGVIAATIALTRSHFTWWTYALSVIVIGARQQGMVVLMHEASHEGLFNDKKLNDLVGEVLLAWPFFVSMRGYRDNHIAHHRYLNSWNDPDWIRYKAPGAAEYADWTYPRPSSTVVVALLKDLFGLNVTEQFRRGSRLGQPRDHRSPEEKLRDAENPVKLPRAWTRARWALRIAVAIVLTVTGGWVGFLIYWVVPLFTMLKMCVRFRQLTGHFAVYGGEGLRTTLAGPIGRFLLGPHNIGFHTEHHLYPMVAWHNLGALHRILVARGDYREGTPFRLTRGYLGVVLDWSRDEAAQRLTAIVHAAPAPASAEGS